MKRFATFLFGGAASMLILYVASISKHLEGVYNESILMHVWFFAAFAIIALIGDFVLEHNRRT